MNLKLIPGKPEQINLRLWVDIGDQGLWNLGETLTHFENSLDSIDSLVEEGYFFHEISFSKSILQTAALLEKLYTSKSLLKLLKSKRLNSFTLKTAKNTLSVHSLKGLVDCANYLIEIAPDLKVTIDVEIDLTQVKQSDFFDNLSPIFELRPIVINYVVLREQNEFLLKNFEEIGQVLQDGTNRYFELSVNYLDDFGLRPLKGQLDNWREFFSKFSGSNLENISLPFGEKNWHKLGRMAFLIKGANFYHMPNVYGPIPHGFEFLKLPDAKPETIKRTREELITKGLLYAGKTELCSECNNLMSCSGNYVLSVMEDQKIKECVYPVELIKKMEIF